MVYSIPLTAKTISHCRLSMAKWLSRQCSADQILSGPMTLVLKIEVECGTVKANSPSLRYGCV